MKILADNNDIQDFFGVEPLLSTSIRVTKKCNLKCKHCYADGGCGDFEDEMTTEEIKDVMSQLEELGVSDVFFTGGEPFTRKDIVEILEYANHLGFNTLISTNGHFITEELAEHLKNIDFKMFQVSIDGDKDTHIKNRGEQAYKDAINAIKLLSDAKVGNLTVGSVMLKDAKEMPDMVNMCVENGIPLFALMLLIEAGRAQNMNGPSPELMHEILEKVFDNYEKYNGKVEFSSNTTLPPALVPFASREKGIHLKFACCSFPYILGIEANGDVAPCDGFFPYKEMIVGNVKEKPLKEIWEDSPVMNELRAIKPSDLKGVCAKCKYLEYCAGGCRAAAYNKYHDLTMPDPACQRYYEAGLFPKDALID